MTSNASSLWVKRKTTRFVFFFVWSKVKINEHVDALGTSTAQHQAMASHSPTHPRFAKARAPNKNLPHQKEVPAACGCAALRPFQKKAGDRPDSPINAAGEHNIAQQQGHLHPWPIA